MRIKTGIAVGLLLAMGAVGCGGGTKNNGVATANGGSKPPSTVNPAKMSDQERALRFAQCMRQHGVDMPDPKFDGKGGVSVTVGKGVDKSKVDAATQQCKQYSPDAGRPPKPANPKQIAEGRRISACMRANGVPKFPDPNPDGGIAIKGGPGTGIDPESPAFKAAQKKCQPAGAGGFNSVKE